VYTLDHSNTRADAIAVANGRIIAVGTREQVEALAGPATVRTDLGGRTVIPGLIDSHNHLGWHGISATRCADLSGSESVDEVLSRLQAFGAANPDAKWLMGQRFDQELFPRKRWPTRSDLDRLSSAVPVLISRVCLHAVVANTAALAPIRDRLTPEQFDTGLLTEDAAELVWSQIPSPSQGELRRAVIWALGEAHRAGLTGVHYIVEGRDELRLLRELQAEGELPVRLYAQCPVNMADGLAQEGLRTGSGDEMLRIGPMKLFMDGSMGARTAAMKEPFTDDPGNRGELFRNEHELAEILRGLQVRGFQASIHAIGDLAVECALKGIELAMEAGNVGNRLRHRIEHASQVSESIVADFVRLNVIASIQPQFVLTDFWTHERVGEARYPWSYPFATMLREGVKLAIGSDCPVERLDPIELIDRAVNREPRSLRERLTVEQTIRAYSGGSAYASFEENTKGSLEVGKLADFAVLSQDIFEVDASEIGNTKVEEVIVGGRI